MQHIDLYVFLPKKKTPNPMLRGIFPAQPSLSISSQDNKRHQ
jgi:hypothetical protein